ncbi:Nipped-A-like protein [Euroglyphus maynei]|uniref:Nipped-A-like protein n=1 Tax=Euroglyphus maynei TaxID=6958 RepID=A0A1Y3BA13_EURMA|nr:Nipped-A-like protein [Euroglyphus maynei]
MHYWIKQAIELILSISNDNETIKTANHNSKLPLPVSLVPLTENQDKSLLTSFVSNGLNCTPTDMLMNMELMSYSNNTNNVTNNVEMMYTCDGKKQNDENFLNDIFNDQTSTMNASTNVDGSKQDKSKDIVEIVCNFLHCNRNYKALPFFNAVAQLCHLDSQLAHHIWIQLFPRIYSILNERYQRMIACELAPFFVSGVHTYQREIPISSVNTFFEAVSHCEPSIKLRPSILRYISRNHNLWHRASLILETEMDNVYANRSAFGLGGLITNDISQSSISMNNSSPTLKHTRSVGSSQLNGEKHLSNSMNSLSANINDLLPSELPASMNQPYGHECMSALAHIYETLKEQDYWTGIWHKKAHYKETLIAVAYEQQGFFEQAKGAYELAMNKGNNEYNNTPIPIWLNEEYLLWESHWVRCSKELNQWDFLKDYGNSLDLPNPLLVLESAWRIPDWDAMNMAVICVEQNLPKDFAWKLALYKGYNALCNPNHRDMETAERMVEVATNFLLKEWRKLPKIVSFAHINILQGAHQVIELNEAHNLNHILYNALGAYPNERPSYELRSLIKTWKNRLPIVADDLSHWSDIFTWRQHHYQMIVTRFEQEIKLQQQQGNPIPQGAASNALCGAHASAQSLIHLAKVARKHFLINVALDQLNRIHTIPKVPIVDCFQKIRQQLKCHLLKHSMQPTGEELQEAMSVIDCTHLHFFQNEMMAEFIALKGFVLMKMNRIEEANKNFSASLQLSDTVVKSWAMWGEFFYEMFTKNAHESFAQRNIQNGKNAIIAFLHASRHQSDSKTRKYLSHVLWLLSYDKDQQLAQAVEQYNTGVPPCNWVPWIQQLLHCLVRPEGQHMLTILSQISKLFPEAVYFPTRTLYLSLRLEQREMKYKLDHFVNSVGINQQTNSNQRSTDQVQVSSATWRCTRIMHHQRELHPTLLTSIEGILDQMLWFRENWFEEILRQLRQALAKCYTIAFENRDNVAETITSNHTLIYIKKLVNTFGIGIDNATCGQSSNTSSSNYSSNVSNNNANESNQNTNEQEKSTANTTASETLARRAQLTIQDPDFQKMRQQFANDFDFSVQGSHKLHNLIVKFKKWIKILEAKTKLLPKSWLLEEKCRYLSNFSNQIVEVALPGEYFLPKLNAMCIVHIARFMPRVEIITKHNTTARRLYIRGHNGKIYPYLILNDSSLSEVRREERFLHLLRLLNLYLSKHKETARRVISFTVARVVPIHGQMRFVEDNVSSLSLIEIYKQHMIRRGSDPDAPIAKYYDRLLSLQTKGSQVSLSQLKDIISDIQASMAPKTLLKEWALQTFSTATEFWHFRKLFTLQMGLAGLSEFAFHLTRLNPDMMYIHRDSGLINIAYYRFDLNEENGELVSNQPVPFRMTHSVQNLITEIGIHGPLTATMIASASCLVHPNYKVRSILLAILRDEIINWHKRIKSSEKMALISSAIIALANNQPAKNLYQNPKDESSMDHSDQQQQQNQQFTQQQLTDVINSTNMNEIPEMGGEELVNLVTKAANAIMSRLQSKNF